MCEVCDNTFTLSAKQRLQLNKSLNVDDVVNRALQQLFDSGKIDKKTFEQLWATHNAPLQKAVVEGYGKTLAKIEYNSPNYEFLKQLQSNTAVFAMFKNHASIKDMAALLKDAEGNVRSKADFIKEAKKIDEDYRTRYLDVEYDTAVRQARMASQWQKIQQNKHLYPNLKYLLTKAAKPDKNHLAYVGIVAPVDNAFWNTHYPPNRWRCQCGVEQTDEPTTDIPSNLPPIPFEFSFNSGKSKQIFDVKNSNYYLSATPLIAMKLLKQATKLMSNEEILGAKYQPFYESKIFNKVEIHPQAFNNSDIDVVQQYSRELANLKIGPKLTQILPTLHDPILRKELLPDAKGMHSPDYRLDGHIYDLKMPTGTTMGKRTIKNSLRDALAQGNGAVLVIPNNYVTEGQLYKKINGQLKSVDFEGFNMYLKFEDKWQHFTQKEWAKFYEKYKKDNPL